ncbi:MAG: ATP-binding protein [Phycisphaerales bacterium]|nr:ATP-binding protein [Phycisphaerales bacterium]
MNAIWLILGVAMGATAALIVFRQAVKAGEARARHAERRAAEAERLAELGSMTRGLAHEIKNPLSTVGLNAQLIDEAIHELELPEDQTAPLLRRVDALGREADRLRTILTEFLRFAGQIRLDPHQHNVVSVLEELADFFHPQADASDVVLRVDLPSSPVELPIDAALIKQAVLNLMLNALHAMRENEDRPRELILRLESDPDHARIHVIDSGPGVPSDMRERIFHPYVSDTPGGTGLGLPTARRIIEEHGGHLGLEVLEGRGSDFIIQLPRSAPPPSPSPS